MLGRDGGAVSGDRGVSRPGGGVVAPGVKQESKSTFDDEFGDG